MFRITILIGSRFDRLPVSDGQMSGILDFRDRWVHHGIIITHGLPLTDSETSRARNRKLHSRQSSPNKLNERPAARARISFSLTLAGKDVEIKNEGKQGCSINTRMIKCCESICPNDVDCEHMQLVGGDMGFLAPQGSRNVTLIWPTLYLHDRVGECVIAIGYTTKNNQTGEMHQKVKFDTSVSPRSVHPVLRGYYEIGDPRKCPTVDLDTLDNCRPANCHIKYNGKRNFYNRRQQRCQAVPICIADTSKELPNVAYVPASNTCRDLENAVTETEVRALSQGVAEAAWRSEPLPYLSNIYCHHGSVDNATGFCVCYDGWTSKPLDNLEPSTEMIHLCNVKMLPWPRLRASRLKIVLIIIAALLGVLVVLFCCAMAHVMRGPLPPKNSPNYGRKVTTNSCATSSTRSRNSTCCSDRSYKPFDRKCKSDTSCPTKKVLQY